MDIIYRQNQSPSANAIPNKGDIVENTTENRFTYKRFSNGNVGGQNSDSDSWKKGSRAQILDVQTSGDAVFIKIKF